MNNTTPSGAGALLQLIESYVEKRHTHGAPQYNVVTARARDAVLAALSAAQEAPVQAVPQQQDERGAFDSWIRTHEDEHGALDDSSAWAGWTGRATISAQAKEAAPRDSLHDCAVGDSNYAAGMLLGWNLCTDGRDEDFRRIREDRLRAAASASKEAQEAAPAPPSAAQQK